MRLKIEAQSNKQRAVYHVKCDDLYVTMNASKSHAFTSLDNHIIGLSVEQKNEIGRCLDALEYRFNGVYDWFYIDIPNICKHNGSGGSMGLSVDGHEKVALQFMVVPELLGTLAYVPDPVRLKVVDAEAIFIMGILGESGRKLVNAGIEFYFARPLAEKLIAKGIAIEAVAVCGD